MLNDSRTRAPLRWLALAGLSAIAGMAQAETAQNAATAPQRNDGVMTFANVRVEVAPPKTASTASVKNSATLEQPARGAGLVATIDPTTGKLTQPTADDMAGLQPQPAPTTLRLRSLAAAAPTEINLPQGGVGIDLDNTHDSYVVVRRNADGQLDEVCAPGEEHALKTLASKPASKKKGELK